MGKCDNCGVFADLQECKIQDDLGIRYRKLCSKCIAELQVKKQLQILDDKTDSTLSPRVMKSMNNTKGKGNPSDRQIKTLSNSTILFIAGIIWFIIAIIMFSSSEKKLDRESARVLGVDSVANFQLTIFTVGAFLSGVLHIIGGYIVREIHNK